MVVLENPEVEEFIKKLEHPREEEIRRIRAYILSLNLPISEHIKWNAPSFCLNQEDRITFNFGAKKLLRIVFHKGVKKQQISSLPFSSKFQFPWLKWPEKNRAIADLKNTEYTLIEKELNTLILAWLTESE